MAVPNGTATFYAGQESRYYLRELDGYAAASSAEGTWRVRANPGSRGQFTLSYGGDESKTLTLSEDSDDPNEVPIVTKPMEHPPHPTQLWTMEECIGPMIFPPMMQGRLQSCANSGLSVVVGGSAPLSGLLVGLSGYQMSKQKWARSVVCGMCAIGMFLRSSKIRCGYQPGRFVWWGDDFRCATWG